MIKILHTSDLHLGKSLYGINRSDEFAYILNLIIETVIKERIDVLLISGDIFDTTTPPNEAANLYYNFIYRLSCTNLLHTVITAGNHDSPSFLNAPSALMHSFNVSVITAPDREHIDKELIVIKDRQDKERLIVCAIPYLRERDLKESVTAQAEDEREYFYRKSVAEHIELVTDRAFVMQEDIASKSGYKVPVVAMAHLFCSGGLCVADDGVRDLFVGTLGHIDASCFNSALSYVALGHLHVPQIIGSNITVSYSGSPLAMGFSEKENKHFNVCTIDDSLHSRVEYVNIKAPKRLIQITGDLESIKQSLKNLVKDKVTALIEIIITGSDDAAIIKDSIEKILHQSTVTLVRIKDMREREVRLRQESSGELLGSLDEMTVFERLLGLSHIDDEREKEELKDTYMELRRSMSESDA